MSGAERFAKRPVPVEAWLWNGEPDWELELWLGDDFETWLPSSRQLVIRTLEGEITASAGDYIIRGVAGEHYPCKPDIFAATYEEASA